MKTFPSGDALAVPRECTIYFRRLDTFVRVENRIGGPVIRATTDRFSNEAKERLIQYLAAEGLIAERCRWPGQCKVQWVIDNSWVQIKHQCQRMVERVWMFLTWGRLFSLGMFLAALIAAAWFKPR